MVPIDEVVSLSRLQFAVTALYHFLSECSAAR